MAGIDGSLLSYQNEDANAPIKVLDHNFMFYYDKNIEENSSENEYYWRFMERNHNYHKIDYINYINSLPNKMISSRSQLEDELKYFGPMITSKDIPWYNMDPYGNMQVAQAFVDNIKEIKINSKIKNKAFCDAIKNITVNVNVDPFNDTTLINERGLTFARRIGFMVVCIFN